MQHSQEETHTQEAGDNTPLALADLAELLSAGRRVAGLLDSAVLAQRAAHEARRLVGTELATLALLEDSGLLVVRGTAGTQSSALDRLQIPRGSGLGGRVLLERRPMEVADYAFDGGITRDRVDVVADVEGIHTVLAVPVERDNQVLGILYGGLRDGGSIRDRGRLLLVEFARSIAPVIDSARDA
jgi:signal transduction protein with GAF and PtsI domain